MAKILVIEDDPSILEGILEVLKLEDYEVAGAGDGEEGIVVAEQFRPDLVVCDIMMPRLDGYGVLERIRRMPTLTLVPFIFLTAKATREDVRYGMDLGADDYLSKPFKSQELLKMIASRLDLQQVRDKEVARQLDQLRGSVSHSLPHELRTPLTNMMGYISLLIEDFEELERDEIKDMLMVTQRAGQRLYDTIEKYMLYARLEILRSDPERRQELRTARTEDIREVIREAATARAYQRGRQQDLDFHIEDTATLQIFGNDLQKIVDELVDNAFKFSSAGAMVVVAGEVDIKGKTFVLKVINKGYGMTPEEIQRVSALVQFQRDVYEQKGVGLGLSIATGLANLYGGTLRIESIPDENTCVFVELPLAVM